jgi:hypothetical protein
MSKTHNVIRLEQHSSEVTSPETDRGPADKPLVDLFVLLYEWYEKADTANEAIQKEF